jgi:multidrug efflux pump subunit AcrA (membrane-fusion protein)
MPTIALAALAFASAKAFDWRWRREETTPPAAPAAANFGNTVAAVGLVEPSSENIAVSTPVSGLVVAVHIKAGDRVSPGAPLFSLDDRDLRAELALRMTNLEVARSRFTRLEHAPRPEEVPQVEAKVREAEAALADAQNQQRLIESVVDKRAIREEDVLRRREAAKMASARLDEARAALALLQAGTWADDLVVARAEVANAQAQVRRVEADLDRLTMRAPIAGEILQLNLRVGEYAQTGQLSRPLLVMGEVGRLHVRADIDENDVWRLRPGTRAQAAERGNSSRRAPLEFVRFEPLVVPKKSLTGDSTERVDTRVLQAIFRFPDRQMPFFVGQQMDVFIEAPGDGVAK